MKYNYVAHSFNRILFSLTLTSCLSRIPKYRSDGFLFLLEKLTNNSNIFFRNGCGILIMRQAIVRIFNPSMVTTHTRGVSTDECNAPDITQDLIDNFKKRLTACNYEFNKDKDGVLEYTHTGTKSWSLHVLISKNEITFTCPTTKIFLSTLLFETLKTASRLCDHGKLAIYYRDGRGWLNTEHLIK